MSDFDLVIVNGVVVTDQEIGEYDIGIKNGKIARIIPRSKFSYPYATKTVDAKGGYVMVCCSKEVVLSQAADLK